MTQQDRPNATLRQYLADCQVLLGKRLEDQGLFDESLQSYRQALNIYQAAMAADPADARSHRLVGFTEIRIGGVKYAADNSVPWYRLLPITRGACIVLLETGNQDLDHAGPNFADQRIHRVIPALQRIL